MWAWESHLVEVCAGFWGDGFEDLHILNEELTGSVDLCQSRAILPAGAEGGVDQTISPGRVKTRSIRVYTGNLSASDETAGKKKKESSQDPNASPGLWEEETH